MTKNIAISMAAAALLAGAAACNSDTEYHTELDGSAMVRTFSLVENNKILADLDSVYFSIDLVSGDIFNADSLPMGTRINGIAANIVTDNASEITLRIPREGKPDSVVNYLEHSADTIDFSQGPVRVEVVSLSGATKKEYKVRITVHKVKSDSLCWGETAFAPLPAPASATAQRTVQQGGVAYTFSSGANGSHSVAATSDFAAWMPQEFTPGFDMDMNSIVATPDAFYALSSDGTLHKASDAAGPWSATYARFHSLYGAYGDMVVGCTETQGKYAIDTYPSVNHVIGMPEGMPVSGFSPAVTLTTTDGSAEQMVITGGRCADGTLSAATFGFDGNSWVRLSNKPMPKALEGVAVAPYYSLRNQAIEWRVDVLPTLLAFGGTDAKGEINDIVYMSRDWGMHWQKADSLLQPGRHMPAVTGAQALVAPRRMSIARSSAWTELGAPRLPIGARFETAANSRATTPITEWDAPYIYILGGYEADGSLNRGLWRGVINRFTFKPIQ